MHRKIEARTSAARTSARNWFARASRAAKDAVKLASENNAAAAVYWFLFSLVDRPTQLTLNLRGTKLRVRTNTRDAVVAVTGFKGEYSEVFHRIPQLKHGLIIDAGGYIGTAALLFAKEYPDATVVSIEPDNENFDLLEKNTDGISTIVRLKKALAAKPGYVELFDRGTGTWGYTIVKPLTSAPISSRRTVDCVTLTEIMSSCRSPGIDILKLDIEGAEFELFSGDLAWLAQTEALCVELHDRIRPGCTELFQTITIGRRNIKLEGEKYLSIRV